MLAFGGNIILFLFWLCLSFVSIAHLLFGDDTILFLGNECDWNMDFDYLCVVSTLCWAKSQFDSSILPVGGFNMQFLSSIFGSLVSSLLTS